MSEAIWLVPPEKDGCLICHEDHEITPETHPEVWKNGGIGEIRATARLRHDPRRPSPVLETGGQQSVSVAGPPPMRCVSCPASMETVIDGAWLCRRCADLYPEVMRLGPEIAARLREGRDEQA